MSEIMFAMMGVDIPTLKSEKKICITDFKRQCITWCDFLIIFYFCSNYFKIKQNLSCKLLSYITFNNQVDETHDNLLAGGLNRKEALDCLAFNLNDTVICKWRNEIASEENCEIEPCSILKLMKTLLKIQTLDKSYGFFASIERPIDFESIDERPVDLVFLLLAPASSGAEHLKALALVSRLLKNKSSCEKLRGSSTPEALYAILAENRNDQS